MRTTWTMLAVVAVAFSSALGGEPQPPSPRAVPAYVTRYINAIKEYRGRERAKLQRRLTDAREALRKINMGRIDPRHDDGKTKDGGYVFKSFTSRHDATLAKLSEISNTRKELALAKYDHTVPTFTLSIYGDAHVGDFGVIPQNWWLRVVRILGPTEMSVTTETYGRSEANQIPPVVHAFPFVLKGFSTEGFVDGRIINASGTIFEVTGTMDGGDGRVFVLEKRDLSPYAEFIESALKDSVIH